MAPASTVIPILRVTPRPISTARRHPPRARRRWSRAPFLALKVNLDAVTVSRLARNSHLRYSVAATIALALHPCAADARHDAPAALVLAPLPAVGERPAPAFLLAADADAPAAPDDESAASIEDRLNSLEERYAAIDKDHRQLADDYDALKDQSKLFATSGHGGATAQLFGRLHVDLWTFPGDSPGANAFETGDPNISPQDRVLLRRIRFGVQGDLWENMLYRIDLELSGGNDPEFRDVYLGVEDLPVLQTVLVGNQKRPYGLDHINSSRYNIFLERPFVVEAFNQDNRRLGVQSFGVTEDLAWNWRYGIFNQRNIQDEGAYISDHYQPELAARLANTFFYNCEGRDYGHWAIAGTIADTDDSGLPGRAANEARFRTRPEARTTSRWLDTGIIDQADDYGLIALENVWNFGPLQVVGEYQSLWVDRSAATGLHFDGGYVYAAYVLTGEHVPWDRKTGQLGRLEPFTYVAPFTTCLDGQRTGWGAWQVAYRYSHGDLSDDDVLGGVGRSHTLGLNWYWNPWAKWQLNAIYGEIDDHAPVAGQTFGTYAIIGTRFAIDF